MVWNPGKIFKAYFYLWLAMRKKLGTHDRLFNIDPSIKCLFCSSQPEDHNHLFFNFVVSPQIWTRVQNNCGIQVPSLPWDILINWFANNWKDSSFSTKIRKLCLAATVYNIWFERNCRYYTNSCSCVAHIYATINELDRIKLSTMRGV